MAAIIENPIGIDGSEMVLNKIGVILFEELENQKTLNSLDNDIEVYIERQEPYDKSEDILINISLNNIQNSAFNEKSYQSNVTYFIDVYTRGFESSSVTGSDKSRLNIHRFVGLVKAILSSTKYKTLGFQYGLIGGTYVENVQYDDSYGNQDGAFIRMARISFNVRVQENFEMWNGINLLGNDTEIKLDLTDKGFKLIKN